MTVFVSHSSEDQAAYTSFCATLDATGIGRWDQAQMAVGQSLAEQLKEAIRVCDGCVFLATAQSVSSEWCMAELGAFWGAGKRVLIFLADPAIGEQQLPAQFRSDLWTRDAHQILESIRGLSSTMLDDVLTPDLVLLLRYLERDGQWVLPDFYGRGLAVANGVDEEVSGIELRGWKRAVRYGLLYLAHHGLADKVADTSVTYTISEYGRGVLDSARLRQRFEASFNKILIPLRGEDG